MEEQAFAKLNLALHVRAREPDGYHRIETLFAFVEHGDVITARAGDGVSLSLRGPFSGAISTGKDNLVVRAADALRARCGISKGVALTLDKRLPVAAGLGGGSADAAATLRLLARFWGLSVPSDLLRDIAAELGADVPACLLSRTQLGTGRGETLTTADDTSFAGMPALLVNPGVEVPTNAVFVQWDGIDRGPLRDCSIAGLTGCGRNDLEQPARDIAPVIGAVLAALAATDGVKLVRMSGSGATCFALYGSEFERDMASDLIRANNPFWWILPTRLRPAGGDAAQ
jgi:4-diphosphocytidyl-2-C-methyl-D-erythritol kinase